MLRRCPETDNTVPTPSKKKRARADGGGGDLRAFLGVATAAPRALYVDLCARTMPRTVAVARFSSVSVSRQCAVILRHDATMMRAAISTTWRPAAC